MKTNWNISVIKNNMVFVLLLSTFFYSCNETSDQRNDTIKEEMISLMNSLKDAAIERDAEKIISFCENSLEFSMISDGKVYSYNEFYKGWKAIYPAFVSHQLSWDTIIVRKLNSDVVAAFAPFHKKIVKKDSTELEFEGEVTWIARKTSDGLKLIYGHSNHRPNTE